MGEPELNDRLLSLGRLLVIELIDTKDARAFEAGMRLLRKAGLEAILKVEVVTPEDMLGDVIGDLNDRRGLILGTNDHCDGQAVEANLPLASIFGYADELRWSSRGRARLTVEFAQFDELSDDGEPPHTEPSAAALRAGRG